MSGGVVGDGHASEGHASDGPVSDGLGSDGLGSDGPVNGGDKGGVSEDQERVESGPASDERPGTDSVPISEVRSEGGERERVSTGLRSVESGEREELSSPDTESEVRAGSSSAPLDRAASEDGLLSSDDSEILTGKKSDLSNGPSLGRNDDNQDRDNRDRDHPDGDHDHRDKDQDHDQDEEVSQDDEDRGLERLSSTSSALSSVLSSRVSSTSRPRWDEPIWSPEIESVECVAISEDAGSSELEPRGQELEELDPATLTTTTTIVPTGEPVTTVTTTRREVTVVSELSDDDDDETSASTSEPAQEVDLLDSGSDRFRSKDFKNDSPHDSHSHLDSHSRPGFRPDVMSSDLTSGLSELNSESDVNLPAGPDDVALGNVSPEDVTPEDVCMRRETAIPETEGRRKSSSSGLGRSESELGGDESELGGDQDDGAAEAGTDGSLRSEGGYDPKSHDRKSHDREGNSAGPGGPDRLGSGSESESRSRLSSDEESVEIRRAEVIGEYEQLLTTPVEPVPAATTGVMADVFVEEVFSDATRSRSRSRSGRTTTIVESQTTTTTGCAPRLAMVTTQTLSRANKLHRLQDATNSTRLILVRVNEQGQLLCPCCAEEMHEAFDIRTLETETEAWDHDVQTSWSVRQLPSDREQTWYHETSHVHYH
ncbi:hypothetical protein GNI_088900 [Gregarina niphandrodes]|uniref:Uncharacterized protein n=1 Tax=Gregarina niphandrodes TaxID=110365 RepID=A0A023B5U8_GRENI|nr:hypothetical protein GNI_088900 [Gregarina niphandrodes]EZG61390.1 hypothetical protein GNI_088900 [Gregarina niphandrodes]|eukprot:XP_011130750.1 hypothetical protein GNI_088900 [Gregarina niphandrodes]